MNLRNQNHKFQGEKLKTARLIRGLTLEDIGIQLGISHQAVSKYENEKAVPDINTIKHLATFLQFEPSFFYGDKEELLNPQTTHFFRSGAAVSKKYKEQVKGKVKTFAYLVSFMEKHIKLPKFEIPDLISIGRDFRQIAFEEIDRVAGSLRRYIGLGDGPISNITALCERLGIIIAFAEMDNEKIDACTVYYKNRPFILLNQAIQSSVRLRFNIAHELGHIVLHSKYMEKDLNDRSKHKRIEQEANRFASAFLMPEATIVPELSSSGLDYLLILKEHWKVSIQAIIYRAEELGIFTEAYALYLRQQISRKKWRLKEPLDDVIQIEQPKLIKQAIQLLINKYNFTLEQLSFSTGILVRDLAYLGDINISDIDTVINEKRSKIIQFPSN